MKQTAGTVTYSSIGIDPVPAGDGNISSEPLMPHRALDDYRLEPKSPGIDAGSNTGWTMLDVDLDGLTRIKFGTCDMGACEFQGAPATIFVVRWRFNLERLLPTAHRPRSSVLHLALEGGRPLPPLRLRGALPLCR